MASENQLTPMNKNKLNDLSYTNDIQYFKSINIMIHFYDVLSNRKSLISGPLGKNEVLSLYRKKIFL